jgi:hypothetical protein
MDYTVEIARDVTDQPEPLAALARHCYSDMAVSVEEAGSVWRIRMTPVAPIAVAYDRDLRSVLGELGIGLDGIMGWHRVDRAGRALWLDSLASAWALVAWSHLLADGELVEGGSRPLIVQVGGHGRLKVPPLVCGLDPQSFVGLMDDGPIDLGRPDTVAAAVERGLLGGSSFLAPFLRACPADIVHITDHGQEQPVRFAVSATPWSADPTVSCLALTPGGNGGDESCSYRRLSDSAPLASDHRPVLLHVDLSWFDQLAERRPGPAVPARSVADLVEQVAPLAETIACVTVSYAPGLCPSRRWRALAGELRGALEPLL